MSCPTATAPINILPPYSNCDLKCDYRFSYPKTPTLLLSNKSTYIKIRPEQLSAEMPVLFNESNYQIYEMRIYTPSLHTYNGQTADAELIIHHTNEKGGNDLLVCIPIAAVTSVSMPDIFSTIMTELASTSPSSSDGETSVIIHTFSLNALIPMKPFYTYQGSLPYLPCNNVYNYIVFNKTNAINIATDTLTALTSMITAQSYTVYNIASGMVFYNAIGPSMLGKDKGDDIYIQCEPTGSDGESLIPVNKSIPGSIFVGSGDIYNILQNKYVIMFSSLIALIIVYKMLTKIFDGLGKLIKAP